VKNRKTPKKVEQEKKGTGEKSRRENRGRSTENQENRTVKKLISKGRKLPESTRLIRGKKRLQADHQDREKKQKI